MGQKMSPETREKLRHRERYDFFRGHTHTEESKKKTSSSMMGRIVKPETREKLSEALTGKPKTIEHRENLSKSRTGFKMGDAQKNNIKLYGISIRKWDYEITLPNGQIEFIIDLREFCDKYGLPYHSARANFPLVSRGIRKNYKGFGCKRIPRK
jgi:hypothetical protein